MKVRLTHQTLLKGVAYLESKDQQLKRVVIQYGPPPLWEREEGFGTLIHIILEQQVSIASAKAAYDRLVEKVVPLTPTGFLTLSDAELKTIGFSRQKILYGRDLATAIIDGRLDPSTFPSLDDSTVRDQLIKIKGIGNWTADVYLLMALGRPDIWPNGDLALSLAVKKLNGSEFRPSPEKLEKMSLSWQPWRAVAARILWHYYLSEGK